MRVFPLLAIVVIIYNVLAFTARDVLGDAILITRLPSGATFVVLTVDLLVALGLVLLFLEIAKATKTTAAAAVDHALSLVVFVVCLVELLLVREMGSASFALITLMTAIDVIAGFTVSIAGARRDIEFGR